MTKLSFKEAKEVSIVDYLASLGHQPAGIRGTDHWYYAPYRDERTPSFKVDAKLNLWYDHGIGYGGTILDLGAKLHDCSMPEFLNILSRSNTGTFSVVKIPGTERPKSKIEVVSITDGFNPTLREYLDLRGIDESIAKQHCKEIEFIINKRTYTAIGYQNRSGAYELRNNWFKGSSAPKDVTFILDSFPRLTVLEGFMDFLSLHQLNMFKEQTEFHELTRSSNFLVLNSISLLNKNLDILTGHRERILLLDNDQAGAVAKANLRKNGIHFQDASSLFINHKDVNEYLQAIRKPKQGVERQLPRSRVKRP